MDSFPQWPPAARYLFNPLRDIHEYMLHATICTKNDIQLPVATTKVCVGVNYYKYNVGVLHFKEAVPIVKIVDRSTPY
jgi:hypothetical protein